LRAHAHRVLLLALFAAWVAVAWSPLAQQFSALDEWRARLAGRPLRERAALLDFPAYIVAYEAAQATPPDACILFLAYTGPEFVNYHKTRLDYHLYPRRVHVRADTGAQVENCEFVAVFRDAPANLKVEPFRGHWDEQQLRERLAGMDRVAAGQQVEVYRRRP
jgi:hypothetical protein